MEYYVDPNGQKVYKHFFWSAQAEEQGVNINDQEALEEFMQQGGIQWITIQ